MRTETFEPICGEIASWQTHRAVVALLPALLGACGAFPAAYNWCAPTTCEQAGKDCGVISDGCGATLDCGTCTGSETCGGGGIGNVCGTGSCTPTTCAAEGKNCGVISDGCGGTLDCGTCSGSDTCGGGGTANVCGAAACTPTTCAAQGANCGNLPDGCGGTLHCGTCSGSNSCGGGGTANVCGAPACTPMTCADQGAKCGNVSDGCGGTLNCGTCSAGQSCSSNVCAGSVGGSSAQYNFDSSTQGWTSSGGMITGVSTSSTQTYEGARSLKVSIAASRSDTQSIYVDTPDTPAGVTVTFHVWVPSGSTLMGVNPYAQEGSAGNWGWHDNWYDIGSLNLNAWNTVTVDVPSGAVTPLYQIGVFFYADSPWSGAVYVDSVSWPGGSGSCTPTTCSAQGAQCGSISDGCGGTLNCGTCSGSNSCGGGGTANVCGSPACTPTTCAAQGANCGNLPDGCGGTLNCGTCSGSNSCGGGGTPNVCGATCYPWTCADQGAKCGNVSDGCGGTLNCGNCPSGQSCSSNVCTGSTPSSSNLWAITIDDPWTHVGDIVDAIGSLAQPMTTRIVFDEWQPAADYDPNVRTIASVTAIQGELLDSYYVSAYSVKEYLDRTNEYLDQLGDVVDIWEVGNEANGEWLGSTSDVVAKIYGAYLAVHARGGKTALTLYYNGAYDNGQPTANNCWEKPENHMMTWAKNNIPQDMKDGLDYVWVSYYEDDCLGIQPDWQAVFDELGSVFPNSLLGIGECGTTRSTSKAEYIYRYYRDLTVVHPRFVGGYFWWYGKEDFVPKTKALWQTLQDAMNAR